MTERQLLEVLIYEKNLTQGSAAEQCGLSRVTLNRFLRGKTNVNSEKLFCLMKLVGFDLKDLMQKRILEAKEL